MQRTFNILNMKFYLLILLGLSLVSYTTAQESIKADNEAIQKEVKLLMEQYARFASFTSDGQALSLDYVHKFGNLFYDSGDESIVMDLNPSTTDELISAEDYTTYVKINYNQGLSVNIDLAKIKITDAYQYKKKNTYRCQVMFEKSVFGFYQKKQIHDIKEKLAVQVIFNKEKNGLTNFKIYKIEKAGNAEDISKKKELKFAMGLTALPQQSSIYSQNINSNESWSTTNNITIGGGLGMSIVITKNINLVTGVLYNSYSSTYSLKDYNKRSTETLVDKDNDSYYPEATANYDDECVQTNVQVPLNIEYVFNPASKVRFYAYAGASFSYAIKTQYKVSGNATTKGYYPEYNVLLENIPEYGFETNTYDESGHWELNQINFLANVGGGIMVSTGLKSVMKFGPNYSLSLTDLGYKQSKFNGDFISINGDAGKTGVTGLGAALSMLWYF